MKRPGETEYEYQQRISREGGGGSDRFGGMGVGIAGVMTGIAMGAGTAIFSVLFLLPEVILLPVMTIIFSYLVLAVYHSHDGFNYHLKVQGALLCILALIWYCKKRFKSDILDPKHKSFAMAFLAKFLYEETKEAKRRRLFWQFMWILLFSWKFDRIVYFFSF